MSYKTPLRMLAGFIASLSTTAYANCTLSTAAMSVPTTSDLRSIHGSGSEAWAVGPGAVLKFSGGKWASVAVPEAAKDPTPVQSGEEPRGSPRCPQRNFKGVWVNSPKDIWIGCDTETDSTGIAHFDGSWHYYPLNANRKVNAIWSSPGTPTTKDLWAVGGGDNISGYAGTFTGQRFLKVGYDLNANGVWGTKDGSIWTLCHSHDICREKKSSVYAGIANPEDVADLDDNNIYGGTTILRGIWGNDPKNLWAVGDEGTVKHFDGADWKTVDGPFGQTKLTAIYGSGSSVWVVGEKGTIFHFDGTNWQKTETANKTNLSSVWVSPSGEALITGTNGTVVKASATCSGKSTPTRKSSEDSAGAKGESDHGDSVQ